MSVNAVDQTTGNTTPLAGNTNNLVGNLSALTTNTKSDAVGAINEVNANKQNATDNNLQTTDKTIVGGINELRSGLTSRVTVSVTLPATTNGRSSVQIDDAIPVGAKVVGYHINSVSTYGDAVSISAYFAGQTVRVTMISNVNDVPQITLNLVVGITH